MPSLEKYSQGYRDGWYDIRRVKSRRIKRRGARRKANAEYAQGYDHGWLDGEGRTVDWWPDYALSWGENLGG